ncbi:antitoxin Xre/MbcA/ParS toxin-binding domain-containing protein [Roseateles sp.]|uniref:antitoxin Xre/MbcA/ParS toxin-binding domain-containing protein n=1 Tax=Roseateles sp. TaxID=1971397 RepID=UPI00286D552A|nr:antitoxin Xre/MbcA/ParS toxin-binding domain-containing protein [Roseateles sp.]
MALHAGAQHVRAELPQPWSDWAVAAWFAAANAHLEGQRPVDRLDSDLDAVLQAAVSLDTVDEFVPYHLRRADGFRLHA